MTNTTISPNSYEQQAINFLASTNTTFACKFVKHDFYFYGDKEKRDIYRITLERGNRSISFDFGQSVAKSGFYAMYGRNKYNIPLVKLSSTDSELKYYAKINFQYDFGHSANDKISRPIKPTAYDVLACLQKYDVGTFENFCSEFGYNEDSRTAEKTYKAVCKEFDNVCKLFSDEEIEQLQEIQ